MARVAFSLARSMSCSRTFGSVFATLAPVDRSSVPLLRARANSRSVCRRPSAVVYQPTSSVSDFTLAILVDLRGILSPLYSIHFVSGHRPEQPPASGEHHHQIAAGGGGPEELPSFLALYCLPGDDHVRPTCGLLYLDGSYRVAQNMTHVGGIPIEAQKPIQHKSSIYGN